MWKFGKMKFKSVVITITKSKGLKLKLNGFKIALCENKTVRHFFDGLLSGFIC